VETNYPSAFLVDEGVFGAASSASPQSLTVANTSISTTSTADSEYRLVHTAGQNPVTVKISGKLGARTFSNKIASFAGPLATGKSYILRVRFRKGVAWARSNIYWEADPADENKGRLTFVPHDVDDDSKMNYQGVFFRWGSLLGIDPSGSNNSAWSTSKYVYKPTGTGNAYTRVYNKSWNATDLPYCQTGSVSDQTTNYLYDNLVDNFTVPGTGDICRFLNPDYRLPTAEEFGAASDWKSGNSGTNDASKADGTAKIYSTSRSLNGIIFPASGYRRYSNGTLNSVGSFGLYWSGSAGDATNAYQLYFNSSYMYPAYSYNRTEGDHVRCVKK
jgi:uncharacterized protein (TIGR02145 family)